MNKPRPDFPPKLRIPKDVRTIKGVSSFSTEYHAPFLHHATDPDDKDAGLAREPWGFKKRKKR